MRLNPADIQSITFERTPSGGYDEEPVDAFVDRVGEELDRILREKSELQEEVVRLRRRLHGEAVSDAVAGARPEDAHLQAVRILSEAQQTADKYVADAEEYCRRIAEDARRHRDEILAEAKTRAQSFLDEAHQQAKERASAAQERIDEERRALETRLAYLRTSGDVYRKHLRGYLEVLLRNVDEWDHAEQVTAEDIYVGAASSAQLTPPAPAVAAEPAKPASANAGPAEMKAADQNVEESSAPALDDGGDQAQTVPTPAEPPQRGDEAAASTAVPATGSEPAGEPAGEPVPVPSEPAAVPPADVQPSTGEPVGSQPGPRWPPSAPEPPKTRTADGEPAAPRAAEPPPVPDTASASAPDPAQSDAPAAAVEPTATGTERTEEERTPGRTTHVTQDVVFGSAASVRARVGEG